MRRRYEDAFFWYPPSRPREAKGGIRAQARRGAFGESWWAKRWMAVLESFDLGARLSRGRSYARNGQVLSIDIEPGQVRAKVQGSRPRPYAVAIRVQALSPADWEKAAQALSAQALFAAKLLAGEMPPDIEEVFRSAGLSLFPERARDLQTECSCPDWSNPCKHVAAVYCLLGEEFDRDPFLLFRLRGLSREELVARIAAPGEAEQAADGTEDAPRPEPPASDPARFWGGAPLPDDPYGEVRTPPVAAAPLKRLGGFPFWRGVEAPLQALEPVYAASSARGQALFLGEVPASGPRPAG